MRAGRVQDQRGQYHRKSPDRYRYYHPHRADLPCCGASQPHTPTSVTTTINGTPATSISTYTAAGQLHTTGTGATVRAARQMDGQAVAFTRGRQEHADGVRA
jgi:hypothetical protein